MILTREQIKQLRKIFKDDKGLDWMEIREEGDSGIGTNLFATYINKQHEKVDVDITDYENW